MSAPASSAAGSPPAAPTAGRTRSTVLFLHHGKDWVRGSEQCLLDLAANVDPARYHPLIVCNAPALADRAAERGIDVELAAGWSESGHQFLPPRESLRTMQELLGRARPALLHVNTLEPLKPALLAARPRRLPVIAHLHLPTQPHERLYLWLHQVAMAVGVSHAVLQGLVRDGMPADRLRVIHNGVDEERLSAGDARGLRVELGIPDGAFVFAAVASLIDRKGMDVLLQAMPDVLEEAPDSRLLLVGSGEALRRLQSLATRLGIEAAVHFAGERQHAGAILRDVADTLVTAARAEAFPLNVLEAALFGLPIIASDIPPHREAITPWTTGLLFPVDDATGLADAMVRVRRDPALASRLGAAAERQVRDRFMLEHYVRAFDDLYQELLGRPRRVYSWLGASCWPRAYSQWARHAVGKRLGLGGVPELTSR